jgi:hypothetical protein
MFILALILISPIYISGLYILFKDDKYFFSKLLRDKSKVENSDKKKVGRLTVIGISSISIIIGLIVSGAHLFIIALPVTSALIYIYWELTKR